MSQVPYQEADKNGVSLTRIDVNIALGNKVDLTGFVQKSKKTSAERRKNLFKK